MCKWCKKANKKVRKKKKTKTSGRLPYVDGFQLETAKNFSLLLFVALSLL